MPTPPDTVRELIASIVPSDDLERAHQSDALEWLKSTPALFDPHLGRFAAKIRSAIS
jgi:hypothetical protein